MELCHQNGALFVLDEIITGFRWDLRGAQNVYGIQPDLSTFGKAMANGFSISALVGKKEFMEAGGIYHDRERVFLLSLTYGAETHHLAAALETMKIYEENPVIEHLHRQGERLTKGIKQAVEANHLQGHFGVDGRACNLIYYTRDGDKQPSQPFRTLFMQEIIKRGIIAPSLVVSYSHTDQDIDKTIDAIAQALPIYARALDEGVDKYLEGRSVKPSMRKYC
jgi:glutamate-1-semialdehyde 2,1-aminomutase